MTIYFIRHGETEYNKKLLHQFPNVPLAPSGREQIRKTAEQLTQFPITKLITSDLERTKESAEIIGQVLNLEPEPNVLFREVRRPSELYGHGYFSFKTLKAGIPILSHVHNKNWHYSDEKNLYDLKTRVTSAVEYLKKVGKEHEHVAVVSHAFILNIFIKYMCSYKDVRIRDYLATLFVAKRLGNGSITMVEFVDDSNPYTCDWINTSYNDQKHLKT